MYEKVNPYHPDKVADRIAGAIVDLAYKKTDNPHIAVEVLIGHKKCYMIIESDLLIDIDDTNEICAIVKRISGIDNVEINYVPQDKKLNENQNGKIRCGDNGIFKGYPTTQEQRQLTDMVKNITDICPSDGKYLIKGNKITICQSKLKENILDIYNNIYDLTVNPLGEWEGGLDVDSGATNRKLGSDMGDAVTGGGLHGKDLSKADVSLNIYAYLKAQETNEKQEFICNIGDEEVNGIPYYVIVNTAREYIRRIGGFEKFAEWGLIR